MKYKYRSILLFGLVAVLSGCASMPNATIRYYLPKNELNVKITQTVRCLDISNPLVQTSVDFTSVYSADLNKAKTVSFSDLDTFYSSGSAEITLSKDGRIEAFNSKSTGAGSEVVATLATMLGAVDPLDVGIIDDGVEAACTEINRVAGEKAGKPQPFSVVLRSSVIFSDDKQVTKAPLRIDQYPQSFYEKIVAALGKLEYFVDEAMLSPVPVVTKDKGSRTLTLVEPAMVPIKVIHTSLVTNEKIEYSGTAQVSQWGSEYYIPIPKPPMFGENTLNLSLHESGKIKSLKYGTTNGAKDLGSAFSTLSDTLSETDADKAAALKSEADVIAQQQRLIKCKTVPDECK